MSKRLCIVALVFMTGVSCDSGSTKQAVLPSPNTNYNYGYGSPAFDDNAKTNTELKTGILDLAFIDNKGKNITLKNFQGKKNVVLVVTRGYSGKICPYCSAQTSSLISKYKDFETRDA